MGFQYIYSQSTVLQQKPNVNPADILNTLLKAPSTGHSIQEWVLGEAESIYTSDLWHLLKLQHSLRIHAQHFTIANIDCISHDRLVSIYSKQDQCQIVTMCMANKSVDVRTTHLFIQHVVVGLTLL